MFYFRSFLLLFSMLPILFTLHAQPNIEWEIALGGSAEEIAYDVELCPDGGYIVVGSSRSEDGDISDNFNWRDFWVVKLTASGELDWESTYGGSQHETARDVLPTMDGGYVVMGDTGSEDGQVSELEGFSDYWVLKLSSSGSIEWEKTLGGSGSEFGYAIEQTADGGYYVAGGSQSSNGDVSGNYGGIDYWVVRLSPTGDIVWENHFGGSRDDLAFSLDKTTDGGCIVAGRTRSNDGDVSGFHTGASFSFDSWVVKLSDQGVLEWERALGGTDFDEGYAVRQTSDGGYVVAGLARSSDGDVEGNPLGTDLWVVKLNADGTINWENNYGGYSYDIAGAIRETTDGGYIITGCIGPAGDKRFLTMKLYPDGELDWQKEYGGTEDDRSFSVKQTPDDGYIIAGRTASDNGDVTGQHGDYDFWVVKLGPCGVNAEVEMEDQSLQSLEVAASSTYQWIDCSDGSFIEGEQSAIYSPELGGDYAVIVQNGACVDTSECISICPVNDWVDRFGDLLIADEDSPTATFQWINCNDQSPIEGATESIYEPTTDGSYAVVVTDGNCSVTSLCRLMCVEGIDETVIINEAGSLQSVADTMNTTFQWYTCTNGSWITGATDPTFTPPMSGEYGVIIRRGDCSATSPCFTYCAVDTSLVVTATNLESLANPEFSTFQWIDCSTGAAITGETSPAFSPLESGEYAVIISQGECTATSNCTTFCAVNIDVLVLENTLQAQADSVNSTFQWIDCISGASIEGATSPLFTPTSSGEYAVIISQGSCVATSACVNITIVGVNEQIDAEIMLFPNPVRDLLLLKTPSSLKATNYSIYNSDGRKVYSGLIEAEQTTINISEFPSGAYVIELMHSEGIIRKKIIKFN
ncbi:T9SS type A sorting domain-containing protein [Lewinella sp.]|uniref:T9SS type A sorting domain-containing protein n=1 Tax=Lewinella sp. TaxID=2004506 RepID=UPI003D6BDF90